jgi:sulfoquinovose isomerase
MTATRGWHDTPGHRRWLLARADALLDHYQRRAVDPAGGFFELGDDGAPRDTPERALYLSLRMAHVFSCAHLMGRPGATAMVDHALAHVRGPLADDAHGGWFWIARASDPGGDEPGPLDASKQHYGHAFAILAGASTTLAGHPEGPSLLADALDVHERRFWDEQAGAGRESFAADWSDGDDAGYRGQNGNMHLVEALMAAYEVTRDEVLLQRAERIARRLIDAAARANDWRLPEHFHADWTVDLEHNRDDPADVFRPYGWTVGHSFEWSRLLLSLWELRGRAAAEEQAWLPDAARALFDTAWAQGWDQERGGLFFSLGWDGRPVNRDRYWWTLAEAAGAASFLVRIDGDPAYEAAYRSIWDFTDRHLIDHARGGWIHQLDAENRPTSDPWFGKPDVYHAFQAFLVPLLPTDRGIAAGLREGAP